MAIDPAALKMMARQHGNQQTEREQQNKLQLRTELQDLAQQLGIRLPNPQAARPMVTVNETPTPQSAARQETQAARQEQAQIKTGEGHAHYETAQPAVTGVQPDPDSNEFNPTVAAERSSAAPVHQKSALRGCHSWRDAVVLSEILSAPLSKRRR